MERAVAATSAASAMSSARWSTRNRPGPGTAWLSRAAPTTRTSSMWAWETRGRDLPDGQGDQSDGGGGDGIVVVGDREGVVGAGVEEVERAGGRQRGDRRDRPPPREGDRDDGAGDEQGDVGVGHGAPHPHEQGRRQNGHGRPGDQPATCAPTTRPPGQPATRTTRAARPPVTPVPRPRPARLDTGPPAGRVTGESLKETPGPPCWLWPWTCGFVGPSPAISRTLREGGKSQPDGNGPRLSIDIDTDRGHVVSRTRCDSLSDEVEIDSVAAWIREGKRRDPCAVQADGPPGPTAGAPNPGATRPVSTMINGRSSSGVSGVWALGVTGPSIPRE